MSTTPITDLRDAGRRADSAGTIGSFYPFWDAQYRPFLIRAVEALPAARFDWKPRPEMFTAHQIVVHIAECERGWIHNSSMAGRTRSGSPRIATPRRDG